LIRAILWDNDGVLVDTELFFFEATRDALGSLEIGLSLDQFKEISLVQGNSCLDLARDLGIDEARIERVRDARNAVYLARILAGVPLIEGVWETLETLTDRLPMAVVTSAYADHFSALHAPHGTLEHFEFALTNGSYTHHKPHPEPYLMAADRLGLAPQDCLVVEDTERGLTAACRAGMTCVVIKHHLNAAQNFSGAHRILDSIREVPGVLDELLALG
jgi:HAD superfamily hydrolase (TIGR01509 family)